MTDISRPRYAIYFTPGPDTALWQFGTSIIGYDAYTGAELPSTPPLMPRCDLTPEEVAEPARYGFHATLRAPFELCDTTSRADVLDHARRFALGTVPFDIGPLDVRIMGGFIALTCRHRSDRLDRFAGACVRSFEPLRAPLSPADRARRLSTRLTPRQIANLDAWGYPYVFDDFTFHMTLTGRLEAARTAAVLDCLGRLYASLSAPVRIDAVSVLEQPVRDKPFRVLARIPLTGSA